MIPATDKKRCNFKLKKRVERDIGIFSALKMTKSKAKLHKMLRVNIYFSTANHKMNFYICDVVHSFVN